VNGAIGDLGGIPVVTSPFLPPGQVLVIGPGAFDLRPGEIHREIYTAAADTVSGYIQRAANRHRRELGLPERDHVAERGALSRIRIELMLAARMAEAVRPWPQYSAAAATVY
jgi:malic enzyme